MTEQQAPVATPEPDPDAKPGIVDTVRTVIADELGKLFDRGKADVTEGKPGGDPAPGRDRSDVSAEVRREVAKLKDAEAKEQAQKSLEERISELEKLAKSATEAAPREFRKITEQLWVLKDE